MAKLDTAVPAQALPLAGESRASYVPTWSANVLVPLGQAMTSAALLAAGVLVVGFLAVLWLDLGRDWRVWATLVGLVLLAFIGWTARVLPERRRVNDQTILALREIVEQRDLNGDGQIGRVVAVNRWRDRAAQPAPNVAEKAILQALVEFMYRNPKKHTTYEALRREFHWTNTEVAARLDRLAKPEFGIVGYDSTGHAVLLLAPEEARRRVQNALDF